MRQVTSLHSASVFAPKPRCDEQHVHACELRPMRLAQTMSENMRKLVKHIALIQRMVGERHDYRSAADANMASVGVGSQRDRNSNPPVVPVSPLPKRRGQHPIDVLLSFGVCMKAPTPPDQRFCCIQSILLGIYLAGVHSLNISHSYSV